MEVFVEQGSNYDKCLKKIYEKHGQNITVIRKKDAKVSKFFGLFEKDFVEVTFMVNDEMKPMSMMDPVYIAARSTPRVALNDREEQMKIVQGYVNKNPVAAEQLHSYLETIKEKKQGKQAVEAHKDESVAKLVETVERLVAKVEQYQGEDAKQKEHANIVKVAQILNDNDFSASYIEQLTTRLKNELTYTEIEDVQIVQKKLFALLAEDITIMPVKQQQKLRIILLVGPTGVGKTTTLAKLAAQYIIKAGLKGRMITIDNWRIGAVYQMERYCEVMKIDLTVASNPTEFRAYMDIYREEADVICIDTTGRSPKDRDKLAKMQEYFSLLGDDAEIYLAVCAGTRINDIREIMQQYDIFKYKSLIVTKFDETSYVGNLLTVMAETKIPVSYITTGQDVPQDFVLADKNVFLAKLKGFLLDQEYINRVYGRERQDGM